MNGPIASERLLLEPLLGTHAPQLFAGLAEPRLYRWISALPPASVQALEQRWLAAEGNALGPDGALDLQWAARRASDGCYVGKLDAEVRARVATNVGYIIFAPFWNQGYATEATRALAAHLERHGIIEQRAFVTLGNLASERVMVKAGFVRTRVLPDNDTIRGQKCADVEFIRRASPTSHGAEITAAGITAAG